MERLQGPAEEHNYLEAVQRSNGNECRALRGWQWARADVEKNGGNPRQMKTAGTSIAFNCQNNFSRLQKTKVLMAISHNDTCIVFEMMDGIRGRSRLSRDTYSNDDHIL